MYLVCPSAVKISRAVFIQSMKNRYDRKRLGAGCPACCFSSPPHKAVFLDFIFSGHWARGGQMGGRSQCFKEPLANTGSDGGLQSCWLSFHSSLCNWLYG